MLMALLDDGVLCVYDRVDALVHDVEALDAESVLREVFDENCLSYRIEWIEPNHESSLLGLRSFVNGKYTLVPDGVRSAHDLVAIVQGAAAIEPVNAEPLVREFLKRLSES
jgi:hypothetical protein